jgi:uncharacterized protein (DUF1501 family)
MNKPTPKPFEAPSSTSSARASDTWRRRTWLKMGGGLAAGAWALGPAMGLAFAAAPTARGKLVVVMLRGALDGLAAVPAVGDPSWARTRGADSGLNGVADETSPLPLNPLFALHPSLAGLHQWYQQGQLLVVHAVASPYRERSHFDAQQMLESGGQRPFELSTGWLGRALAHSGQRSVALSPSMPVALRGSNQASTWTPSRGPVPDADLMDRVAKMYQGDSTLSTRFEQALGQRAGTGMAGMAGMGGGAGSLQAFSVLARQAGRFLVEEGGPDLAWLDIDGWDTHTGQANRLQRQLTALDSGLLALREALGPRWAETTVLVMTEFGRAVVPNGSGGTDHGTGGVAFLAGGAVAGGRVLADWPGLASQHLLDGRDLRPTLDIRGLFGPLLQRHLGLAQSVLSKEVLPGAGRYLPDLWRA